MENRHFQFYRVQCPVDNFMWPVARSKSTCNSLLDDKLHVSNHVSTDVVGIICTRKSNTSGKLLYITQ